MNRLKLLLSLVVFLGSMALMAQTVTIRGTVTAEDDGLPIPGVAVAVRGTMLGVFTDADGNYTLQAPENATVLTYTFVGMKSATETIAGRTTINVVMSTDMLGLDEVVVTALGITREKKALGYAVQEVSGSELANAEETNIVNALQGKAAGVQITRTSGAVGASAQILIRGIKSFGDNQPLWVVDGTPVSNTASGADQWAGVDFGNNASDIDPETIESISILKGANAAALYGSRARNGVVLVTTKRGKAGKVKVSLSNSTSFDRVAWLPTYQNKYGQGYNGSEFLWKEVTGPGGPLEGMSYQDFAHNYSFRYVDGMGSGISDNADESWGARLDAGIKLNQFFAPADPSLSDAENLALAAPWISHPNNIRDFFQTGVTASTSVSMEGGTESVTARMTYSNILEKGTIPNTDQQRNQINLSTIMNLSPKLKIDVALNYAKTNNDNLPGQGYDVQNVMQSIGGWFGRQVDMQLLKDNWDTFMPSGMPYNWNSNYHNNPYWTVYKNTASRDRERIFGNAVATYQLTDWLNIMGRYGMDYYTEARKQVVYEGSNDAGYGTGGYFWENSRNNRETNADLFLNFQKEFASLLQVSGNLGTSYRNVVYNYMYLGANELTIPNFFHISNVSGSPSTDSYFSEVEQNSVFGALNLGYAHQLYLDFTARNDWSSTLPREAWSYFYPSASLGWIFTETFGLTGSAFSYGKLRASWAKVGSDTSPYRLSAAYTSVTPSYDGNSQFAYPNQLPPIGLKPEFTTSTELGMEIKLFNNRIGLDVAYFNNTTNNQIIAADISGSSGFTSRLINAGEIESKGVEIQLDAEIVRRTNFMWSTTVNWSRQRTVVNELAEGVSSLVLNSSWSPTTIEARPHEPFGQIYGIAYQRDANGNKLLQDGLELPTPSPVVCGNTMPKWLGSINNSFRYKEFSANVLVDAKWGGDIYSVTKWFGDYAGITEATVANGIRENGVVAEGIDIDTDRPNEVAVDPQEYFDNYWGFTEPAIVDGSFFKLREINFGYDLKIKSALINNINIGLFARNVAVLYLHPSNDIRIDPETGYGTGTAALGIEQYQLPPVRSMGFKLRVDF